LAYKITKRLINRAYHEAGHAIVCWILGVIPHEISIKQIRSNFGFCEYEFPLQKFKFEGDSYSYKDRAERVSLVYLAGEQAGKTFNPKFEWSGDIHHDKEQAMMLIKGFFANQRQPEEYFINLQERAKDLVCQPAAWKGIEALVEELKVNIVIPWANAKEIIQTSVGDELKRFIITSTAGADKENLTIERIATLNTFGVMALIEILEERGVVLRGEVLAKVDEIKKKLKGET
jgi:hypothetical protein